jgi:hypothetical protein
VSVVWALWHVPLFAITRTYRAMPAVGFYFSLLVASLVLAWLYLAGRASILVVAVFHAVFDIATTTPTTSSWLPILMGAAVTIAGLATIPYLLRARAPARSTAVAQPHVVSAAGQCSVRAASLSGSASMSWATSVSLRLVRRA